MSGLQTDVMSNTTQGLLYGFTPCLRSSQIGRRRACNWIVVRLTRFFAVGLEPPGELPCWPCSHLPVTKSRGRTARGEHGQPISRSCDAKTHRSCWPGGSCPKGGLVLREIGGGLVRGCCCPGGVVRGDLSGG